MQPRVQSASPCTNCVLWLRSLQEKEKEIGTNTVSRKQPNNLTVNLKTTTLKTSKQDKTKQNKQKYSQNKTVGAGELAKHKVFALQT